MKFKWLISFYLLFVPLIISAQEEEAALIDLFEQSGSRGRVLALAKYCDENVFSKGRTPEKFHFLVREGHRIAIRDQDNDFKDYLDFYTRRQTLMFIPINDLQQSETEVLKHWKEALKYYESIGDDRFIAICMAQIGESHFLQNQYIESIESLLKAEVLFAGVGYDRFPMIGRYLHHMALIFYFFRDYERVVNLMKISVKLPPHNQNLDIQRHNTLGAAYIHLKENRLAEESLKKTIETAAQYEDDLWVALASGYLANLYMEQGKLREALSLYENTLEFTEAVKNSYIKEHSEHLLGLTKAHILLNQLPLARKFLAEVRYKDARSTRERHIFGKAHQDINYWLNYYSVKHQFHRASGEYDLAYFYSDSLYRFKYLIDSTFNTLAVDLARNRIETQKKEHEIEEQSATAKTQYQLLIFLILLAAVVIIAALLLFVKNKKVKSQNLLIQQQMEVLEKILNQKQVLLKELQHRVKNNLQHVISILEIQKESVDFNNIEELVRENQNRIQSMALLHNKLNGTGDADLINLKEYLVSLSGLVKDSYGGYEKGINLSVCCETEYLTIDKALPVGLIVVELISNSIKHAFDKQPDGTITIYIGKACSTDHNVFIYKDNGKGFDFDLPDHKGLGIEIIKGLTDQLDGRIVTTSEEGFELKISFT